ncbi:MAG: response regulator, partial [Fusobacteriota bacterium]
LGEGTTFFFEIPYKLGNSTDVKEKVEKKIEQLHKKDKFGKSALLVDDNEINREIGREMLINNGVETTMAEDGRRAVEILKKKEFDIIFMDVQMPIMNGFEATQKIKDMDERKDIPIIAMTAHATREDREICLRKGMDDYISKPIKSTDISEIIDTYL